MQWWCLRYFKGVLHWHPSQRSPDAALPLISVCKIISSHFFSFLSMSFISRKRSLPDYFLGNLGHTHLLRAAGVLLHHHLLPRKHRRFWMDATSSFSSNSTQNTWVRTKLLSILFHLQGFWDWERRCCCKAWFTFSLLFWVFCLRVYRYLLEGASASTTKTRGNAEWKYLQRKHFADTFGFYLHL